MFTFDFLSTQEAQSEAGKLLDLLKKVEPFMDGEQTADDMMRDIERGVSLAGVMRRHGDIVLLICVSAFQLGHRRLLNINSIAGSHLAIFVQQFFDSLYIAATAHHCDGIQARARPCMARLIKRYGKQKGLREFSVLRIPIQEKTS